MIPAVGNRLVGGMKKPGFSNVKIIYCFTFIRFIAVVLLFPVVNIFLSFFYVICGRKAAGSRAGQERNAITRGRQKSIQQCGARANQQCPPGSELVYAPPVRKFQNFVAAC